MIWGKLGTGVQGIYLKSCAKFAANRTMGPLLCTLTPALSNMVFIFRSGSDKNLKNIYLGFRLARSCLLLMFCNWPHQINLGFILIKKSKLAPFPNLAVNSKQSAEYLFHCSLMSEWGSCRKSWYGLSQTFYASVPSIGAPNLFLLDVDTSGLLKRCFGQRTGPPC